MKKLIIFPLILLCLHALPQAFISGEVGTRLGINAGYTYHNIVLKAGGRFFYTRDASKSSITYAALGYQIGKGINITPLIGVANYKVTDFTKCSDPVEINNACIILSLEAGKDFETRWGNPYRIYLFASHTKNTVIGVGLRIFIM